MKNPREKNVNKVSFPSLLAKLVDDMKLTDSKNIESAFRVTGIIPVNAQQVLKRLPNIRADENLPKTISETLLQYIKDIRTPSAAAKKPRKKMLKVVPGKSVSLEELQASGSVNDDEIVVSEHENVVSEQEDEDKENNRPEFFSIMKNTEVGRLCNCEVRHKEKYPPFCGSNHKSVPPRCAQNF
ncbi:hypothetical protein NQ314_011738 [Rhamnusium bicolor]|uniref:Uncharacterized protein n=1 Tax=Rhamnusium bicolor TaxID=1586634 RepID=A0AAV8XGS3_9CUCU|nr:hypothetical protein NQ314_011738 [Rhamnusium bicolor]